MNGERVTWRLALRGSVPRLSINEWQALDPFLRWFIAVRGQVLIMTLIAAGLGGLLAHRAGRFDVRLFLLCTLGLLLAHATNNLLNDATDFYRGVDKDNYARSQYGPHPLAHKLVDTAGMIRYIVLTGGPALAIGIYFTWLRGMPTLWLFGAGIVFVLFYTCFSSLRNTLTIVVNIPIALVGSTTFLLVSGFPLSVPAIVGFIAVFGVAVQNGMVMVSYINKLRGRGLELREAVITGASVRLRAELLSALIGSISLVPFVLSSGTGAEIEKPLAIVVVGGVVSSLTLSLFTLPLWYKLFPPKAPKVAFPARPEAVSIPPLEGIAR